jgi:hypothetical protein
VNASNGLLVALVLLILRELFTIIRGAAAKSVPDPVADRDASERRANSVEIVAVLRDVRVACESIKRDTERLRDLAHKNVNDQTAIKGAVDTLVRSTERLELIQTRYERT